MKWFLILLAIAVGYAIYTGNLGGAADAGANYNKLLRGQ